MINKIGSFPVHSAYQGVPVLTMQYWISYVLICFCFQEFFTTWPETTHLACLSYWQHSHVLLLWCWQYPSGEGLKWGAKNRGYPKKKQPKSALNLQMPRLDQVHFITAPHIVWVQTYYASPIGTQISQTKTLFQLQYRTPQTIWAQLLIIMQFHLDIEYIHFENLIYIRNKAWK